jgi:hypothetical protein
MTWEPIDSSDIWQHNVSLDIDNCGGMIVIELHTSNILTIATQASGKRLIGGMGPGIIKYPTLGPTEHSPVPKLLASSWHLANREGNL